MNPILLSIRATPSAASSVVYAKKYEATGQMGVLPWTSNGDAGYEMHCRRPD